MEIWEGKEHVVKGKQPGNDTVRGKAALYCGHKGYHTGNEEKLSSSQAEPCEAIKSAELSCPPFTV